MTWNPNRDIRRSLALSTFRKEILQKMNMMRDEDPELWLEYGEYFLDSDYDREESRAEWTERLAELRDVPPEILACGMDRMVDTLLETLETYYHQHREEVAKLLGHPIISPYTPEQSVERLIDEVFRPKSE